MILGGVLTLGLGFGTTRLEFSTDQSNYLSKSDIIFRTGPSGLDARARVVREVRATVHRPATVRATPSGLAVVGVGLLDNLEANRVIRTGRAFIVSALTAISGVAVIAMSSLPLLRDFGEIVALNVTVALLSALIVLPPMLAWADKRNWVSRGLVSAEQLALGKTEKEEPALSR